MRRRLSLFLYAEAAAPTLDISEISRYVLEMLPQMKVATRPGLIPFHLSKLSPKAKTAALERLAQKLARAKVRNPAKQSEDFVPLPGEIDYERRRLSQPISRSFGILYDGFKLMSALWELMPEKERSLNNVHVVFTNQLFGTWEEDDRRYHARVSLYGFPCLISTTGIVEAPAKARQFYLLKQQYSALGMSDATAMLEAELKGSFIAHDDRRLTEVMKGYVLQAICYHVLGDPFCTDKKCRLYNAHWQQEVIEAQLGSGELCAQHLRQLRKSTGSLLS